MVGNFQGRKPSQISRFYSHPQKFSPRSFGHATPIYVISLTFRKSFSVKCSLPIYTVESCLANTTEKLTSTIMQTLCLARNAISIDLHTIRTPEMWPPCYSIKRTLVLSPTVSMPIQTHPHTFVGSLVKQILCLF